MLTPTANLYISVGQALQRTASDGSNDSHYRRQRHTYLVSIEQQLFHIPGFPRHASSITHFEAVKNASTDGCRLARYSSKAVPPLFGNILIAAAASTTADQIQKLLAESIASSAGSADSYADDENDHRLRIFIHTLQRHGLVVSFDVDEFLMWTHTYATDRVNGEAPPLVAYPRAHKDYRPQSTKPVSRSSSSGARERRRHRTNHVVPGAA